MARTILGALGLTVVSLVLSCSPILAAENGTIHGNVRDAVSGDPLPGANVLLVGTSLGGSTDLDGKFAIRNVPPGAYTVRTTYIGYTPSETKVDLPAGSDIEVKLLLQSVGVRGKEVVVMAQVSGQNQAINQQLTSDRISNVVSAARIQELPDANAAESVGRLPGISVLRSGGEGDEVVIRGLAPKYNQIMINGVEMSSTNPDNRSVDLSMISSNMLEGIQVYKTVTPDMDANVIGGVVNFELREARVKKSGVPEFGLLLQGGYNNLSNVSNKLNNYKYVGSAEDRFFNGRFGIFAQLDAERKNLSSNELGASYGPDGSSRTDYLTQALNLNDVARDRQRYNGTVVMDYKLPDGMLKLSNFLSTGKTGILNRGETFQIANGANQHFYSLAHTNPTLNIITNSLHYSQQLPVFHVDARLAQSYSETKAPHDWTVTFVQNSAGLELFSGQANINPQAIPKAANDNLQQTFLNTFVTTSSFSRERQLTGNLNLSLNANISHYITSVVKFGGEFRHLTRSYELTQYGGQGLGLQSAAVADSLITSYFPFTKQYVNTTSVPIGPYVDAGYNYGKFLNGDYLMTTPLNFGMWSQLADMLQEKAAYLTERGDISYHRDDYQSTISNYSGYENQAAGYIMATVKLGPEITVIPGVRYQSLTTTYTAPRGLVTSSAYQSYQHYDTTVTENHAYFLPDISLRYKPLDWFDLRLSYTNTLAYPDFNAIVPKIDENGGSVAWNNYALVPSRSTNYDAYLSFYNNSIGLFTVGGFLKRITNLIYSWSFKVSGSSAIPYLAPRYVGSSPGSYTVNTFVNNPYRIDEYGLELDWETHFWYLPGPLSGLILNVNYTHTFSKAEYPYQRQYKPTPRSQTVYVDTSYVDRLLYQPDDIVNLSAGYDYKGFSVRVSLLYQADIFSGPNFWPQVRTTTAIYRRWDFAVKQDLPWFGIQLYGDLNNFNSENDVTVIQAPGANVPQSEQSYGMTADLGLRWRF